MHYSVADSQDNNLLIDMNKSVLTRTENPAKSIRMPAKTKTKQHMSAELVRMGAK